MKNADETELSAPRRRGRPSRLSRERIIDAARTIPAHVLTMSGLARALGIPVTSVYRYFASKELLLAAITRQIMDSFSLPIAEPRHWREWLYKAGDKVRQLLLRNPVISEMDDWGLLEGSTGALYEPMLETLELAGFSTVDALKIWSGVIALAYNFALASQAVQRRGSTMSADFLHAVMAPAASEHCPRVQAAAPAIVSLDIDDTFAVTLQWLIAGIPAPAGKARKR